MTCGLFRVLLLCAVLFQVINAEPCKNKKKGRWCNAQKQKDPSFCSTSDGLDKCKKLCDATCVVPCKNAKRTNWCKRQKKEDPQFCGSTEGLNQCNKLCDPKCVVPCKNTKPGRWCKRRMAADQTFCDKAVGLEKCNKLCDSKCVPTTTPPTTTPSTTTPPTTTPTTTTPSTTTPMDWVVFQRRVNGAVDFYRGWADYSAGFGDPAGDVWLGLDNIHSVCGSASDKCELRVDVTYKGVSYYAEYSSFYIADSSDNYRLHLTGYSGDAGDSMLAPGYSAAGAGGMQFSTFDRDNDKLSGGNCAFFNKGAWWYNQCYQANLNGLWGVVGLPTHGEKIVWWTLTGFNEAVEFCEMKMRRV